MRVRLATSAVDVVVTAMLILGSSLPARMPYISRRSSSLNRNPADPLAPRRLELNCSDNSRRSAASFADATVLALRRAIHERLGEPGLTVAAVAGAVGIS